MGFFRIFPDKDSWITDQGIVDLSTRATGSNHGSDTALSVFARKGEFVSGTVELGRSLIHFPLTELSGKMFSDKIIPSSSINFYLKMFNLIHDDTEPTSYDLFVYPLSRSWDEGTGIDDVDFLDRQAVNWIDATSTAQWVNSGSDFITSGYGSGSQHFDNGAEDLEVDITSVVNAWLTGNLSNNGLVVKLGTTEESNAVNYYVKKFHSFQSKFIDRIPYIEARWSYVLKDNRKNFAFAQTNNLYLYNFIRGELTNVNQPLYVRVQDSLLSQSASYSQTFTASFVETGIYSASIFVDNTASFSGTTFYDIWYSGPRAYFTGNFKPLNLTGSGVDQYTEYVVNVDNLKPIYTTQEEGRFKVTARKKDFKTFVGPIKSASLDIEREYIEKMYYSISNEDTGEVIVPFATGTIPYTQLSYDANGNYFNLFMNNFVPGFVYRIKFLIDINKYDKKIIDNNFKFKVI